MIVRRRMHWVRMLFVWRGSVVYTILPQLGIATAIAVAVTLTQGHVFGLKIGLTAVPFTLLGITLAIFLGFRNTVSYERYWEARKLWGSVLNESRSATRQSLSLCDADAGAQREFVYGLIAFVHALRHQLRGTESSQQTAGLLPPDWQQRVAGSRFPPAMVLLCLGERIAAWRRRGELSDIAAVAIDRSLGRLGDALGGCERIASTPIPFSYSVLLHRTIYLYAFLLPFGLVDLIGDMTPLVVLFVSYTFFALDALAEEIQEPFGLEPNDLALDAISLTVETALREMLGETSLPPAAQPLNFVLS
ncbi:bestrophin family protein [Hydrocarboniphaga sp.]|uniref:bestrophin family protein n=1 Tax=Hydrocarboniphaga sp. TaxID=2033016 RepID=UPI003D0A9990